MHYKGIKDLIKEFKEPFDRRAVSTRKAKERLRERGDKATAEAVQEEAKIIIAEWDESTKRGQKLHKQVQDKKAKTKSCIVEGWEDPKLKGFSSDPSQNTLKNNTTYIEKKIVSDKYKLVGYADEVEVKKNFIIIEDSKSSPVIYKNSAIRLKNGFVLPPKFYSHPLSHLQECNFNDAALQMSLYMYLLWIHNKKMKPGKLYIRHIKTNTKDKIIDQPLIEVPYLRDEVKAMLKYRLENDL